MEAKQTTRKLPATSYGILGLLTFGERSGYDLSKLANESIGFFFSPAKSQIYSELRRLVSLGFATEREVEQERRPDKRLYAITEEGRSALRDWLESPEVEPDEFKSPFLLKVFFGAQTSRETLLAQLRRMRAHYEEELETYRTIERVIRDEPSLYYPYLTLRCGLKACRASIRWIDETIAELEARETHREGSR